MLAHAGCATLCLYVRSKILVSNANNRYCLHPAPLAKRSFDEIRTGPEAVIKFLKNPTEADEGMGNVPCDPADSTFAVLSFEIRLATFEYSSIHIY